MALTDTFIKNLKWAGAPAGEKHTDGQGLYLLVKATGKYWRMNYRLAGKQKTLAIGVYPAVTLAKAAVEALGGKGGGGRPDMAQGGGADIALADAALKAVEAALEA